MYDLLPDNKDVLIYQNYKKNSIVSDFLNVSKKVGGDQLFRKLHGAKRMELSVRFLKSSSPVNWRENISFHGSWVPPPGNFPLLGTEKRKFLRVNNIGYPSILTRFTEKGLKGYLDNGE